MSLEYMAGRFEGLSDLEWKLFNDIFPPEPEKRSSWNAAYSVSICTEYLKELGVVRMLLMVIRAKGF